MEKNTRTYFGEWSDWTKKFATVILFIFCLVLILFFGTIIQDLVMSLIIAFVLFYPSRALTRWLDLPYGLSVAIVFLVYFGVITYFFASILPPLTSKANEISVNVGQQVELIVRDLKNYEPSMGYIGSPTEGYYFENGPLLEFASNAVKNQNVDQQITGFIPTAFTAGVGLISKVPDILSKILIIHFLAILILLDIPKLYTYLKNNMEEKHKREYSILLKKVLKVWNSYFKSQVFIAAIVGGLTTVELYIFGVEYAPIIGFITAIFSIVPILGGLVALIPISLIPLLQGSELYDIDKLSLTLLVVVINIIIQTIVWNIIAPYISANAVKLPAAVIIIVIFAGTAVGGVLGALLAAPIFGMIRILSSYIIKKIQGGDPFPDQDEPEFLKKGLFRKPTKSLMAQLASLF